MAIFQMDLGYPVPERMQTDNIIPVIPLPLHRVWTLHGAETNHTPY